MKVCGLCDLVMASNLQSTKESNNLSMYGGQGAQARGQSEVDGVKGHVGFPIPFMAFKNDFYHHVCQLSSKVGIAKPAHGSWLG